MVNASYFVTANFRDIFVCTTTNISGKETDKGAKWKKTNNKKENAVKSTYTEKPTIESWANKK